MITDTDPCNDPLLKAHLHAALVEGAPDIDPDEAFQAHLDYELRDHPDPAGYLAGLDYDDFGAGSYLEDAASRARRLGVPFDFTGAVLKAPAGCPALASALASALAP